MTHPRPIELTLALTAAAGLFAGCDSSQGAKPDPPPSATQSATVTANSGVATEGAQGGKPLPLLDDVEDVAVGAQMDCARKKDSSVWCWHGDGGAKRSIMVEAEKVAVVSGFVCAIQSKGQIACAKPYSGKIIDVPLYRDGVNIVGSPEGYCVDTEDGVLRCGVEDREQSKVKPPSGLPGLKHPSAFSVGARYGCGLVEQDVWCWNIEKGPGMPRTMVAVKDAKGAAVGRQRACLHTEAGDVWCYDLTAADKPYKAEPRKLAGWSSVAQLTMAYDDEHPDRLCARSDEGSVRCGELAGQGQAATFGPPAPIKGVKEAVQIATGATAHGCVRTQAGTVACWQAQGSEAKEIRLAPASDRASPAAKPQD